MIATVPVAALNRRPLNAAPPVALIGLALPNATVCGKPTGTPLSSGWTVAAGAVPLRFATADVAVRPVRAAPSVT
ncbi:MAG: hypothetical protein ACK5CE_04475, partial [Actinomycetes bacterium]